MISINKMVRIYMADVVIEKITDATPEAAGQIALLLPQLSARTAGIDSERLAKVLQAPGALYVARSEGIIIGMAQRVDVAHVLRSKSWIEDLVVDEKFRGQGIAGRLLDAAIKDVPDDSSSINLTSDSERTEAHKNYLKLGFAVRDGSAVWRLTLK